MGSEDKQVGIEAATFEGEEINTEPAISRRFVGTVDEPDEPDKALNTETAISHKNVGTGKKYIVPYRVDVGQPQTEGTGNAPPNRKDRHSYKGY